MPGMAWIAGGEFDMGAVVNGQGSGGLGSLMPSPASGFWVRADEKENFKRSDQFGREYVLEICLQSSP